MAVEAGPLAFPPIDQYAFLADGETCALVAPNGAVEWLCLPRPDAPSVFAASLDRAAGRFRIGPRGVGVPAGRRYLPGTLILETTWQTRSGWLLVTDALCLTEWHDCAGPRPTRERAPGDWAAAHALVRTVRCLQGSVQVRLDCEPVFGYGVEDAHWERVDGSPSIARTTNDVGDACLCLATDLHLGFDGRQAHANHHLEESETAYAAIVWSDGKAPSEVAEASRLLEGTAGYWRRWLSEIELPDHPWRSHLERSAIVLKGLTYARTGATLAAATTSLPEVPAGERNWDYRYSWLRDSSFTLWALYTLGFATEAEDYFAFVADVSEDGPLQVLYGIWGERELPETIHEHLSGYGGAAPVRSGNGAASQLQLDMWGVVLDAIYLHVKSRDEFTKRVWDLVERLVPEALAHWREPDQGIWEIRSPPRHFTSSKLMCWVAADRGARLADRYGAADLAASWAAAAEEIKDDICRHGIGCGGHFTQAYGSEALDASLLLLPLMRFLPRGDPRVRATVLAVADGLSSDGLILRYRLEHAPDGLSGEEFTFTICSFWLVSALMEIGETDRARKLCEKLLSLAAPLGLYAEELDSQTGRHWGNVPQAFTHLALINAVAHVIRHDLGAPQRLASLREDVTD
jgi:GH15 family glucan-1,4-alpha-glucosidase